MYSDQDNPILCNLLQETTPITGALGVYAVGSTKTPAQFKSLNSGRRAKMSNRTTTTKLEYFIFSTSPLPASYPNQIIAFFRELIISLRCHGGINENCQGLCLVIAGPLPEFVCP